MPELIRAAMFLRGQFWPSPAWGEALGHHLPGPALVEVALDVNADVRPLAEVRRQGGHVPRGVAVVGHPLVGAERCSAAVLDGLSRRRGTRDADGSVELCQEPPPSAGSRPGESAPSARGSHFETTWTLSR